jgi:HAD superfamily hydrolase (TIGR01509 family)
MLLFKLIKDIGIKIGVASNSIRETLDTCLDKLGIKDFVDVSLSNEDVQHPKPDPEIYIKCMSLLNVKPENAVIYEDSDIGHRAAIASKAHLVTVYNRSSINHSLIRKGVEYLGKD